MWLGELPPRTRRSVTDLHKERMVMDGLLQQETSWIISVWVSVACWSLAPYLQCANASASRNPRRHHMKLDVQEHDQRCSRRTEGPNPTLMLRQILSCVVGLWFSSKCSCCYLLSFSHIACTMVFRKHGNEEASKCWLLPFRSKGWVSIEDTFRQAITSDFAAGLQELCPTWANTWPKGNWLAHNGTSLDGGDQISAIIIIIIMIIIIIILIVVIVIVIVIMHSNILNAGCKTANSW